MHDTQRKTGYVFSSGLSACVVGLLFTLSIGRVGTANEPPTPEQIQFFEKSVRPLLLENCSRCHSEKVSKGSLRLDSRGHLLLGGDSGPAVIPGNAKASLLIQAVRYESYEMPPDKKLSDDQIAVLTRWVQMGAPWPGSDDSVPVRKQDTGFTEADRSWWAFQPVIDARIPESSQLSRWQKNGVDAFIAAELEKQKLTPAPEADRRTLIWRVYYDLIGLPPDPEAIRSFENDPDPQAFERLVDELLNRPEYGERWARHWLDLVRFAESDGYRADIFRDQAWQYRDYVIQSLNEDKPYNRFVQEQIAGDELFPDDPAAVVATGFLRHGMYEYNVPDVRGQWDMILNEMTDVTADVFLGMGFQCARCHDHKFDPILQKDYFRLRAFFASVLPTNGVPAATPEQIARYESQLEVYQDKVEPVLTELNQKLEPHLQKVFDATIKRYPDDLQEVIQKSPESRTPLEKQYMQFINRLVHYEQERVDGRISGAAKDEILALRRELAKFDSLKPAALRMPMSVQDVGPEAPPTIIPKKNIEVQPGFLTLLDPEDAEIHPPQNPTGSTGRRTALAKWLTSAENPLTPRVMVNRVWQYHFGRGLAANSSDLGNLGGTPSHPELLDWLTSRFLEKGWRLKDLHRLIVTSATYRQSAYHPELEAFQQIDPANRYYWRGDVRRLDAEQIRDGILTVTGRLEKGRGGPSVSADQPRRSIYTRVMRNSHDPLLQVFDLPLHISSTSNRNTTTSPIQSLLLFNSQTLLTHAMRLNERITAATNSESDDPAKRIEALWWTVLGRSPSLQERAAAVEFLKQQESARIADLKGNDGAPDVATGKVPYRDGQAVLFTPSKDAELFQIPSSDSLQLNDFTIEMYFQLRSIYESGEVRTLAAKMASPASKAGWLFAITGKGSRRKPQTLVVQLFGKDLEGRDQEAVIFSDHHVDISKPYYAAAVVQLAKSDVPGKITFYLKDLSNDDEPVIIYERPLALATVTKTPAPVVLGSRQGTEGRFDGLIDDVRLSNKPLPQNQLLLTVEGTNSSTVGYWQFEPHPGLLQDTLPNGTAIVPGRLEQKISPKTGAFVDLCHVLLNSNEFLYVD